MAALTALSLRAAFARLPKDEATERYQALQEVLREEALLRTRVRVHDELGELLLLCRQYPDHNDAADETKLFPDDRKDKVGLFL